MIKSIHYNNHINSQQKYEDVAKQLLDIILNGEELITLTIDDGDGDVWQKTITVINEGKMEAITQIKENDERSTIPFPSKTSEKQTKRVL